MSNSNSNSNSNSKTQFEQWHYAHGENTQGIPWVDKLVKSAFDAGHKSALEQDDTSDDDERMCEVCRGSGTIDETLGGEWNSNHNAPCPECEGLGYWVKS